MSATRYILIDNCSGYIFADTADLNGPPRDESPLEAVARFEDSIGAGSRSYHMISFNPHSTADGYHVYRSDATVPAPCDNGQDNAAIEAVQQHCQYLGFVYTANTAEIDSDSDEEEEEV